MKFRELTADQQEKAIAKLADVNVDYEWWERSYDSIHEAAKLLGFYIDIQGFDIDRGQDVALKGTYYYEKGCVEATKNWPALRPIAEALQQAQRPLFYRGTAVLSRSNSRTGTVIDCDDDDLKEAVRDFCHWACRVLQEDYEYLTSREAIIEAIEANEYDFEVKSSAIYI